MTEFTGTRVRQWTASSRVECVEIMPDSDFEFLPGHVVTLAAGDADPGYFAVGSAPSEGPALRFYLRPGGTAADSVLAAEDGDSIRIAGPIAHGFPLDGVSDKDLLFVGVGTGVAPLRSALVEALLHRGRYGRLILVMGAADPSAVCCSEEFETWRAAGVEVLATVDEADDAWTGGRGFVQDHLAQLDLNPSNTVAHVAGVRPMEEAVRERLTALGLTPEDVRANY
jgi:NAD(P)H-flavin reductase